MSTKGSWQRPYDDKAWAAGFERIFGKKVAPITVTVPDDLPGRSSTAEQGSLTASVVSSNLTAPAIYVDDATGAEVTE